MHFEENFKDLGVENTHQTQSACVSNNLIGQLIARDHNCLNNTINREGASKLRGDRAGICSSVLCFSAQLRFFQTTYSCGMTNQLQEVHTCTSKPSLTCRRSRSPFCAAAGNP